MAAPRAVTQPAKITGPTVMDNPEYVAELATLTDLETKLGYEEESLKVAEAANRKTPDRALIAAATERRTGVATPVADIAEIRHEIRVLNEAIRQQKVVLDEARIKAFKPICEAAKPAHLAAVQRLVAAGEEFVRAEADLRALVSSIQQRGDGLSMLHPLQDLGINRGYPVAIDSALTELRLHVSEYAKEGVSQ